MQSANRRLLAILAHPDDESFGLGGTLAVYSRKGVSVHLICATRGEVGAAPADLMQGYATLADLRMHELRCAATILGLAGVEFLDYRDSGMPGSPDNRHPRALASAPTEEVASQLVRSMRRLRPQVVLTFDPNGGYGHPDHIAIHKATTKAFHAAGDPLVEAGGLPPYQPQKLYYSLFPRRWLRLLVRLLPLVGRDPSRWGKNADIDLRAIAAVDLPTHAHIDIGSVADVKARASGCHASQAGPPSTGLPGLLFRLVGTHEYFLRAHPEPPIGLREVDLFEGVTDP